MDLGVSTSLVDSENDDEEKMPLVAMRHGAVCAGEIAMHASSGRFAL